MEKKESKEKESQELVDYQTLLDKERLESWQEAGLCWFAQWFPGKQVTTEDYRKTVNAYKEKYLVGEQIDILQ